MSGRVRSLAAGRGVLPIAWLWFAAIAPGAELFDSRPCMGTLLEITIEAQDAASGRRMLDSAFAEADRLESLCTNWREDSELSRFNRMAGRGPMPVSSDLYDVLSQSRQLYDQTLGAFDVTLGPLILSRRHDPSPSRLREAVASSRTGGRWLAVGDGKAELRRLGMAVDLGGIAKGFATDRLRELLSREGARAGFIDFGKSSIAGFGPRDWRVSLRKSNGREGETIRLFNQSLSTSEHSPGTFDPRTGNAVVAPRTVSVRMPSGALADGWSTALVVLGRPGLAKLLTTQPKATVWYEDSAVAVRMPKSDSEDWQPASTGREEFETQGRGAESWRR